MNKRQKKKLYKKLHGHNPPKEPKKQLPEPQPKQTKDTVKTIAELSGLITEKIRNATKVIKGMERQFSRLLAVCMKLPWFKTAITAAEEYDRQQVTKQRYFLPEELYGALQTVQMKSCLLETQKEPPCIVVAEVLTRQRAAGKRKKYHTRNRRKRKWH